MALLDRILQALGTSRIQLRWRWRRFRDAQERGRLRAARRVEWFGYRHKICPRCAHPADSADRECPSCGAALGSALANRAGRIARWMLPESAGLYTALLTLVHVLVFAVALRRAGLGALVFVPGGAADALGAWSTGALRHGEWWRLVTSNFLHLSALHLIMNSMSLLQIGPLVEELFGRSRFAFLYLATGVAGMAASAAWRWGGPAGAAGASAAIFGLIGVTLGYGLRRGGRVGAALRDAMLRWALWGLIICMFMPADNVAHLGGAVAGVVLGLIVPPVEQEAARGVWSWLEVASATLVAASFYLLGRT
ncbi:MAG: rhomboid family intramembrane serine protease [Myxococcota bacterium]